MKQNTTYSSHPNRASKHAQERTKKQYPTFDTSTISAKKKKSLFCRIIIPIIIFIAIILVGLFVFFTSCSNTLASGKTVEVTIEEGSSTTQIADKMSEAGIVQNKFVFLTTVSQMGAESNLKSGTYLFEGGKSVKEYIEILCKGSQSTSPQLLIAEGMTIEKISKEVEKTTNGKIKSDIFISEANNANKYSDRFNFLKDVNKNSLEGFLFPKTYSISSNDTCETIIIMMLEQFEKEIKNLDLSYAHSKNLSLYDVVTLASIIEKESTQDYLRKVSSVFYNRLASGMHLDSDATTAYEIGHTPSGQDVHSNSEYSTYTNYGFPPTPICSPGIKCLEAACNPENTDYLYFACNKDSEGKTNFVFSTNFNDHQQALIDLGIVY